MADYNGWTNRETWLVWLWYGDSLNAEAEYQQGSGFEMDAEDCESFVEGLERHPDIDRASLTSDFLSQCFRCVDWHEIAKHANQVY